MDIVNSQDMELKKLWKNKRQLTFQALNLAMIVFSALMIWKGLMFATKSESPVVVVLRWDYIDSDGADSLRSFWLKTSTKLIFCSGSMEPAFQRGDILFLNNQDSPIRVGEIVVFKIKDRDIPIVHRVMKVHEKEDGKVRRLDNINWSASTTPLLYSSFKKKNVNRDNLVRSILTPAYD